MAGTERGKLDSNPGQVVVLSGGSEGYPAAVLRLVDTTILNIFRYCLSYHFDYVSEEVIKAIGGAFKETNKEVAKHSGADTSTL
ncbi:uncharacterized protein N7477_006598 [Penicillium maclennaniae]|uniref:uncharacterized protein n=1 Tax=Penicillium maclennaniae TaxID=1343394 RepID=UPI002541A57F|nr:uncharacterized protein N7477_006598 [Penicillium maclennaniae]KAJ5668028.1 hypothetical protein N7477_006598 [Penicillium maclennaniae]